MHWGGHRARDQAEWSPLYLTKSRPFDRPKSSKIAIKVINHYGDAVMKVLTAPRSVRHMRRCSEDCAAKESPR